jgi:transposase-like protein
VERKINQRHYSRQTKIAVLAALDRSEGNFSKIAVETGIAKSTIRRWLKEAREDGKTPLAERVPLDQQLEELAWQLVEKMPEKVSGASLQELARVLPIVLSTLKEVRISNSKENSTDAREKLARLLAEYAEGRGASGSFDHPNAGAYDGGRGGGTL